MSRRKVLKTLSAIPLVGGLMGTGMLSARPLTDPMARGRDYFKELGLRTFINAAGTYTSMTGCLMGPEVMEAINYASNEYVNLDDLQDRVGQRIAELLQCEYATVSSGAFGAMTIGLAGIMCGMDNKKVSQLPDTKGLKNEVIFQKSHSIGYTHALSNTGAKLIEVETREQLERAINKNTAMLWFLNANTEQGAIKQEEFVALSKKHNIPCMIDCAADVPPVENLFK